LTIGQSPRVDVVPEVVSMTGKDLEVLEAGALDNMSPVEIAEKLRPGKGETIYVSRLRDGTQVVLSKEKLVPLLQERIRGLEERGASLIVLLCSGEFPRFRSRVPIIYLDAVLKSFARPLSEAIKRVGVMVPVEEQVGYAESKWGELFEEVVATHVSPYTGSEAEVARAAKSLRDGRVGAIIMDCIGYNSSHRRVVESIFKGFVTSTRTSLARYLAEILPG